MTAGTQSTFVVEYSCDQFCRIEIELTAERGHLTLQQMREKADASHRRIHEPEGAEEAEPVAEPAALQRPATNLFSSPPAPGAMPSGGDDGFPSSSNHRGGGRGNRQGRGRSGR